MSDQKKTASGAGAPKAENKENLTVTSIADNGEDVKLKPCPFCGSSEVFIPHIGGKAVGMVQCNSCHALVSFRLVVDDDEIEISERWNRRTII